MKGLELSFHLKSISSHRNALMGLATIGILMCHASSYEVNLSPPLMSILALGQLGVDMFFFLSGFGLFFSLCNLRGSLLSWYKKRIIRVFLPYSMIYGPVLLLECVNNSKEWWFYFYNFSTLSFWFGDGGCWFIAFLLPLYIIVPFWKRVLDNVRYTLLLTICLCFILITIVGYFMPYLAEYLKQVIFFFVGIWIARYSIEDGKILNKKHVLFYATIIVILLILYCRLNNFIPLFWLLFFPLLYFSCKFFDWLKMNALYKTLNFMGSISLESYLLNVTLIVWINAFSLLPQSLYEYRYIFILIFGVIFSYIFNKICRRIISFIGV